jgi:hypothetical protein
MAEASPLALGLSDVSASGSITSRRDLSKREGRMMKRAWPVSAVAMVCLMTFCTSSFSQETDTKWLVGVWEGESRPSRFQPYQVRVELKDEAGEIRFETLLTSPTPFVHGSRARGTAKVSGDAVTMQGEYYAGGVKGGVSYSLTRKGDLLEGTGIGGTNIPFSVSLKKVK